MSLRVRLLIGALVICLVGLIAADVVTIALVRSSMLARTDDRLDGLADPAQHRLLDRPPGTDADVPTTGTFGRATGYFAEIQDRDGSVIDRTEPAPTATPLPTPSLPAVHADDPIDSGNAFSVGSVDEPGFEWRVQVAAVGSSGSTLLVALPLTDLHDTVRSLALIEGLVTSAVLAAIVGLGWWVVNVGLRPLREMERTAEAIAEGDLSQRVRPSDDRTEIGRLGSALNVMLAQIEDGIDEREASESRLRHFVADASHELRTPVTAIRGYAELYEQGLLTGDALPRAMRRMHSESLRMSSLTEDLLTLARLDRASPHRREDVDLVALAAGAVTDARAIEPDRPLTFTAPTEAVHVEADPHQLHQVVANLLGNVRAHTPPTAPASVEVGVDDRGAVVTVTDTGPGIPAELGAAAFERFRRADPSRTRANGGAGLGLAIVAGIVEAHGGRVVAANRPEGGAEFVVALPQATDSVERPSTKDRLILNESW